MNSTSSDQCASPENAPKRDGVFYLVLADLVGSDEFAAKHGNPAGQERVTLFANRSREALGWLKTRTSGIFIKMVGDAALFVFNHFPDVLEWHLNFWGHLTVMPYMNQPMKARTCVHIGEIRFGAGDVTGTAVNALFKFEQGIKQVSVKGDEIFMTEVAKSIAEPTVFARQITFGPLSVGTTNGNVFFRVQIPGDAGIAFLSDKQAHDKQMPPTSN